MSTIPDEDDGLLPENAWLINARHHESEPWSYFRRRLIHLAMTADPDADAIRETEFNIGDASLRVDPYDDGSGWEADVSPIVRDEVLASGAHERRWRAAEQQHESHARV
jgi:hypothetical protein